MKKIISTFLFFLTFGFGFCQFERVDSKKSHFFLQNAFLYLDNNFDSIRIENFKDLKQHDLHKIYCLQSADTTIQRKLFNGLLTSSTNLEIIKDTTIGKSIVNWDIKPRNLEFSYERMPKSETIYCHLSVYPLVKFKNRYFLKLTSGSKRHEDDMYGGNFYFLFNEDGEIIFFTYNEVMY